MEITRYQLSILLVVSGFAVVALAPILAVVAIALLIGMF